MEIFFLAIVAPFKPSACFSGAKRGEGPPSLLVAESTASWSFSTAKMRWGALEGGRVQQGFWTEGRDQQQPPEAGTVGHTHQSELRLEAWGLWLLLVSTLLT